MELNRKAVGALAFCTAALVSLPAAGDRTVSCESLATLNLPDTTITKSNVLFLDFADQRQSGSGVFPPEA